MIDVAKIKSITSLGDFLSAIRDFREEVKRNAGHQLDRVQRGLDPDGYKPMSSIGAVDELIELQINSPYPFSVAGYEGQYAAVKQFD